MDRAGYSGRALFEGSSLSRAAVATGIGLIFIATLLLPLALYATE